jgi:uncharacterized protein YkwD
MKHLRRKTNLLYLLYHTKGATTAMAIAAVFFAWFVIGGLAFFGNDLFDRFTGKKTVPLPIAVDHKPPNSLINKIATSVGDIEIAIPIRVRQITEPVNIEPEVPNQDNIDTTTITDLEIKVQQSVIAPPPLFFESKETIPLSSLTSAGVITWTNFHREQDNKKPLVQNKQLDDAAKIKLDDMFAKQYFEHESPTGEGPADVVAKAGYDFLTVGENLALGDFRDDEELVTGWMNSPGHRENILKSSFTQIGVAVGKADYQGRQTWLAVQEFGTPKDVCDHPDQVLLKLVKDQESALNAMNIELHENQKELSEMNPQKDPDAYNNKVSELNALVKVYNNLVAKQKQNATIYNDQVNDFNICLASFK